MPKLAIINENECIGCTKCLDACPFDAIIGAAKQMHIVINAFCTGCGLCVSPCPVDCISMITIPEKLYKTHDIKKRKQARTLRLNNKDNNFSPLPAVETARQLLEQLLKNK